MKNKVISYIKNNDDVFLHAIIGAASALAGFYYIKFKFAEEMMHQVERSAEDLGLTETIVNHMQTHVYPKK